MKIWGRFVPDPESSETFGNPCGNKIIRTGLKIKNKISFGFLKSITKVIFFLFTINIIQVGEHRNRCEKRRVWKTESSTKVPRRSLTDTFCLRKSKTNRLLHKKKRERKELTTKSSNILISSCQRKGVINFFVIRRYSVNL